jgi:hypothetical protein
LGEAGATREAAPDGAPGKIHSGVAFSVVFAENATRQWIFGG